MGRSLNNIVAGLSPRERRLLMVTGVMFFVFLTFIGAFLFSSSVGDLEDERADLTTSLRLLDEKEGDYLTRNKKQPKRKVTKTPTPLRTLVEKVCKKLEMDTPDMKELPDQSHGQVWVEHAMELTIRQTDILKLTEFMEEIESSRRQFPIAISKLSVNKRKRSNEVMYNVQLTVSTYEQQAEAPEKAGNKAKRKRKPARKGGR